jgi:hypothetical protein
MKAFSPHLKTASIYFSILHCRNDPQKILRTKEPCKPYMQSGNYVACMKNICHSIFKI